MNQLTRQINPTVPPTANVHCAQHNHNAIVNTSPFGIIDTTMCSEHLKSLRLCLNGSKCEEKLMLHMHNVIHRRLVCLLWKVDEEGRAEQKPSTDITKGKLITLCESIAKHHPDAGSELLRNNFVYFYYSKRNATFAPYHAVRIVHLILQSHS